MSVVSSCCWALLQRKSIRCTCLMNRSSQRATVHRPRQTSAKNSWRFCSRKIIAILLHRRTNPLFEPSAALEINPRSGNDIMLHKFIMPSLRLLFITSLLLAVNVQAQTTAPAQPAPPTESQVGGALPAIPGLPALTVTTNADGTQEYTVTLQILAIMTMLTFLPALLMMMTSFTRIIIVCAILLQARGLQQPPSNLVLIALALVQTLFSMQLLLNQVNENTFQPYINQQTSAHQALANPAEPCHEFMLGRTR